MIDKGLQVRLYVLNVCVLYYYYYVIVVVIAGHTMNDPFHEQRTKFDPKGSVGAHQTFASANWQTS